MSAVNLLLANNPYKPRELDSAATAAQIVLLTPSSALVVAPSSK
jgi:hypothetical protein